MTNVLDSNQIKRTPHEQLDALNRRLGEGQGAVRERARLQALIMSVEQEAKNAATAAAGAKARREHLKKTK